jgi:hypothetical protein
MKEDIFFSMSMLKNVQRKMFSYAINNYKITNKNSFCDFYYNFEINLKKMKCSTWSPLIIWTIVES